MIDIYIIKVIQFNKRTLTASFF